jgi:hypothetical protein
MIIGGQPTLGDSSACWLSGLPAVHLHKNHFYEVLGGHETCVTCIKR